MGKALRGAAAHGGVGRGAVSRLIAVAGTALRFALTCALTCALASPLASAQTLGTQGRGTAPAPAAGHGVELDSGRFTVLAAPRDGELARSLLSDAIQRDTFPGLPRPRAHATIVVTPDAAQFRRAVGTSAPEWGAAVAFPAEGRVVVQGSGAGSDAGDPRETLRHELAHLALYEALGTLPPRWFDEGYASYAAGELARDDVLATNVALAFTGIPPLDSLDAFFQGGASRAQTGYALARQAVAQMAELDRARGLSLLFTNWRETKSLDVALRRAYGVTEAGFEAEWRTRTRRRYGALALLADLSFVALLFLAVAGPLWVMRRRRDRRRLERMRAAEAVQERRARDEILHQLLRHAAGPDGPPEGGADAGNDDLIK